MLENISVLYHSSIKFNLEKVIYVDPYNIDTNYEDADIIFITHSHYDHYSKEDINKIKKSDTVIVAPKEMHNILLRNSFDDIVLVEQNNKYNIGGIQFETIPAYNINSKFHPRENGWVGYIIEINKIKYYIAGDTDITEENKKIKCDVAFVPIGGTFTMDYKDASKLINEIKPKIAVPIHYGSVVGTKEDALEFIKLVDSEIECRILMK